MVHAAELSPGSETTDSATAADASEAALNDDPEPDSTADACSEQRTDGDPDASLSDPEADAAEADVTEVEAAAVDATDPAEADFERQAAADAAKADASDADATDVDSAKVDATDADAAKADAADADAAAADAADATKADATDAGATQAETTEADEGSPASDRDVASKHEPPGAAAVNGAPAPTATSEAPTRVQVRAVDRDRRGASRSGARRRKSRKPVGDGSPGVRRTRPPGPTPETGEPVGSGVDDDEVVELVSATPATPPWTGGLSWILVVLVIAVSVVVGGLSWRRRLATVARTQYEDAVAKFEAGQRAGAIREIKGLLERDPDHRFAAELGELRDRSALLLAADDLTPRPERVQGLALSYLERHPDAAVRALDEAAVWRTVGETWQRRFNELGKIYDEADRLATLRELDAERERLRGGIRDPKRPPSATATLLSAIARLDRRAEAALARLSVGKRVAALVKSVKAELDRRRPVPARALLKAGLEREPKWAARRELVELGQEVDRAEAEILRFRPESAALALDPERTRSLQPMTRRVLKRLPGVLDDELPVFLAGDGVVMALDPATGASRWSVRADNRTAPRLITLELRDVYLLWREDGHIEVRLPDGRSAGGGRLPCPFLFPPVTVGSKLYAPGRDGVLRVVDLETVSIIGRHLLSGRLVAPLGVDDGTGRVVAALEHDLLALLAPDPEFEPQLIHESVDTSHAGPAPIPIRDFVLHFSNPPDRRGRMRVYRRDQERGRERWNPAGEFLFDGWILRRPPLLNGRLVVTTDKACLYPFSINTVDLTEGVQPGYQVTAEPRRLAGESLLVTELVLPNHLYVGGRLVERHRMLEQTRWWTREKTYDSPSPLPDPGIVHRAFQITEDRIFTTSQETASDGLVLTSLLIDSGRRLWQARIGLPTPQPLLILDDGRRLYCEQGGAIFPVPEPGAVEPGVQPVDPWLADFGSTRRTRLVDEGTESLGSSPLAPLPVELNGDFGLVRATSDGLVELWRRTGREAAVVAAGQRDITTNATQPMVKVWERQVKGGLAARPVLTSDGLVAASSDGRLHVLSPETGRPRTAPFKLGAAITRPRVLGDSRLVVGAGDGSLRIIELARDSSADSDSVVLREFRRLRHGREAVIALAGRTEKAGLWSVDAAGVVVLWSRTEAGLSELARVEVGAGVVAIKETMRETMRETGRSLLVLSPRRVVELVVDGGETNKKTIKTVELGLGDDQDPIVAVQPAPAGHRVLLQRSGLLRRVSAEGAAVGERRVHGPVLGFAISGDQALVVGARGRLTWWDLPKSGEEAK